MQAAVDLLWPEQDAEVRVRHAAAVHLLGCAGNTDVTSTLAHAVRRTLGGSLASLGIKKKFKQVLTSDPLFNLTDSADSEANVVLNVAAVQREALQRQQMQPHVQPAPPNVPPQHQPTMFTAKVGAAINKVWPAGAHASAETRVRNAAAVHLAGCLGSRSLSSPLAGAVAKVVGKIKALGMQGSFGQVLSSDSNGCFRFESGPTSNEAMVVLNVGKVMRLARALEQPQQQVHRPEQRRPPPPKQPLQPPQPPPPPLPTAQLLPAAARTQPLPSPTEQAPQQMRTTSVNAIEQQWPQKRRPDLQQESPIKTTSAAISNTKTSPGHQAGVKQDQVLPTASGPPQAAKHQEQQQQQQQREHQHPCPAPAPTVPVPDELLKKLAAVPAVECSLAEVVVVQMPPDSRDQQLQPELQDLVLHVQAAKLAALDFVFECRTAVSLAASSSRAGSATQQLLLVQWLVPSATCRQGRRFWPTTIYSIMMPEQQQGLPLAHLQRLLEDVHIIKVMHDVRPAAKYLLQQHGILLEGVLDTQLLAGLVALAASTASGCSSTEANGHCSSTAAARPVGRLGRATLTELCLAHGYPVPEGVEGWASTTRALLQRPLSCGELLNAAADSRVRYLLPLAHDLLHSAPGALLSLSGLQVLLAQQGAAALQLKRNLVQGYGPLIQRSSSCNSMLTINSSDSDDSGNADSTAVTSGGVSEPARLQLQDLQHQPGMTQLAFELQVPFDPARGWYLPQYLVYLNEEARPGLGEQQRDMEGQPTQAAMDGNELQEMGCGSTINGVAAAAAGHTDEQAMDEAVMSIAELLPDRVLPDLEPFFKPNPAQPQLIEIIADRNKPVMLRFADRTSRHLDYSIKISAALDKLASTKQLRSSWQAPLSGNDKDALSSGVTAGCEMAGEGVSASKQPDLTTQPPQAGGPVKPYQHLFGSDNRMGVPGTLHRISAMRDPGGLIYGLTYRIGRHMPGVGLMLADLLSSMKASLQPDSSADRPQSLLVLGRPGVGKTTLLRDIARLLADPPAAGGLGLTVVIVDTSNEIAGDALEAHACVGAARRMMVPHRNQQADVLIQAVQNHAPDVIIVDEIGNSKEVAAARTIAQRGVLLVGTAHGNSLRDLMANPELRPLVGGVQAVTLGDAAAQQTNKGNKTRLERAGAATFVTLLELRKRNEWCLHLNVEDSVDSMLNGPAAAASATALAGLGGGTGSSTSSQAQQQGNSSATSPHTQVRMRDPSGHLLIQFGTAGAAKQTLAAADTVAQLAGGPAGTSGAGTAGRQAPRFAGAWLVDLLHAAVHRSILHSTD